MSNLNGKFDVVRGWSGDGVEASTIVEDFRVHDSISGSTRLKEGDIVEVRDDGKVALATSDDLDEGDVIDFMSQKQYWLVLDGNEETNYDTKIQTGPEQPNGTLGYAPFKVTCIRGTYMFETQNFNSAGTYVPGDKVAVEGGEIVPAGTRHVFGEVREYDAASEVLTIVT